MFWKKIRTKEYLELKQEIESLKINLNSLRLDFDLITKKLKVKYKISTRDKEDEDLKGSVLLPE